MEECRIQSVQCREKAMYLKPSLCLLVWLLSLPQPLSAQPTPIDRTDQLIVVRRGYDYAPAVIFDDGKYRLYWCAGIAGDFILHSESQHLEGPWRGAKSGFLSTFDIALQPTGSRADFDGLHTCDPNVIKVGGTYYLYYGGNFADDGLTAVGVARSVDGVHFQRMNEGKPILTAAKSNPDFVRRKLTYGAGQPAVLFLEGFYYLSISDSTGSGANPGNGAGQFLLRARDPIFQTGLQEFTRSGWMDRRAGQHTAEFSVLESFGLDWMFDPTSGHIIVATNRVAGITTLLFLNAKDFSVVQELQIPVKWREGPGLLAGTDRNSLPRSDCDRVPISIVSATGPDANPWSWDIALTSRLMATQWGCR
jgi:hypothetical protein